MFKEFFLFELKYRLKQPMVYIFLGIITLMIFGATASDNISVGGRVDSIDLNSAYLILRYTAIISIIGLLMVTAFMNTAALRDYNNHFHEIIYSKPISKLGFLGGRFLGAVLIAMIPSLGVFLGVFLGCASPWVDPNDVGPMFNRGYWDAFWVFIVPNTLFIGAFIFAVASLSRSTIMSFMAAIGLLVLYILSNVFVNDIENETFSMLADPFGIGTYSILTKYWTVEDKNTLSHGLTGMLLLNRLLWLGVSALIFAFTYFRFSFQKKRSKKQNIAKAPDAELKPIYQVFKALPKVTMSNSFGTHLTQLRNQVKIDFWGVIKSTAFIVIMAAGILNMFGSLQQVTEGFGNTSHPVTYRVINMIRGSLYLFLIAILVFYSGLLVWKERDNKMDEIYDALPFPGWVSYVAKFIALVGIIAIVQLLGIAMGMLAQAINGYTNFELGLYFKEMLVMDLTYFAVLGGLSMLVHTLVNNKYIGYFVFIALVVVNVFGWSGLDVSSNMLIFGSRPTSVYSDMNGFGPFVSGLSWFTIYWMLFTGLLGMATILYWVRGRSTGLGERTQIAKQRLASSSVKWVMAGLGLVWLLTAGFVFYNTQHLNTYDSRDEQNAERADYEKTYKKYKDLAQPRITSIDYQLDFYPSERDFKAVANVVVQNKTEVPISEIHFTMPSDYKVAIDIANSTLELADKKLEYRIYKLIQPLAVGDSLKIKVNSEYITQGFENEVQVTDIVRNGSFINNQSFMPAIGYQESIELSRKSDREEHELAPKARMPELHKTCSKSCSNTYISNDSDWINVSSTLSTSNDQIAIAPGSLVKEWEENGRKYFQYKLNHPVLNFYSFISADYEVKREKWGEVDLEVYYHKGHEYNVDKMMKSMRESLTYYSENFGPYPNNEARIIEFPRYASFAQAFPGTMPYSEEIGFIADLEDEEDIDHVFYIVAHEMAHQWWAHQVIGAAVQGCTMLSETFSQYSALMVMEKEYGREKMKRFLEYEMDRYLRGRGREDIKEMPLVKNENQQYIHYRKGSVVMYALRDYIGEENLNNALRNYLNEVAFQEPPYTTTHDVMRQIKAVTPDSLQYLITDMFETITLYGNRTTEATYKELADGKYEVNLTVEVEKFRADSLGKQTPLEVSDWIDIGVLKAPEKGKKEDQLLVVERKKITKSPANFTFVVDEKPTKAGIDPNYLLIDRMPDDNIKKLTKLD